jgi:hypothetical protein
MILYYRMLGLFGVRGNTLGSSDAHERLVPRGVRFFCGHPYSIQLLGGVHKTLVSPGNVVINFDPEYVVRLCVPNNGLRIRSA